MTDQTKSLLGRDVSDDDTDGEVEVRLLNFPLQVYAKAREHHEELLREFALLALSPPAERPGHHVPQRFLDLVNTLGIRYAGVGTSADAARDGAVARGESTVDLDYHVPRSVGPAARELRRLIEEADEYCRDGQMLTMALAATEREFLWWFLDEFTNQAEGADPRPWSGALVPNF